jgi:hypothetical protein
MWFCRKSQNIPAVIKIANTQETQRKTVAAEILGQVRRSNATSKGTKEKKGKGYKVGKWTPILVWE